MTVLEKSSAFRPRSLNHYMNALVVCYNLATNSDLKEAIMEIGQILEATSKQWPKFFSKESGKRRPR